MLYLLYVLDLLYVLVAAWALQGVYVVMGASNPLLLCHIQAPEQHEACKERAASATEVKLLNLVFFAVSMKIPLLQRDMHQGNCRKITVLMSVHFVRANAR